MDSSGLTAAIRPCLEGVGTHMESGDRTRRALPRREKTRTTVAGQCRVLTGFAEQHADYFGFLNAETGHLSRPAE